MSNIYQDIETQVLAKFQADAWFVGTPADPGPPEVPAVAGHVTTLVTDLPDTMYTAVDWTEAWPEHTMPAVVILTGLDNSDSAQETFTELRYEVPIKVLGTLMAYEKHDARNNAQELMGNIERVLNACRTTAGSLPLGYSNFIKSVTGRVDINRKEAERRWYGLVEVDAVLVAIC